MNEAEKYHQLKESIRIMEIERRGIERNNMVEEGEKMAIDKIIKKVKGSIIV